MIFSVTFAFKHQSLAEGDWCFFILRFLISINCLNYDSYDFYD